MSYQINKLARTAITQKKIPTLIGIQTVTEL